MSNVIESFLQKCPHLEVTANAATATFRMLVSTCSAFVVPVKAQDGAMGWTTWDASIWLVTEAAISFVGNGLRELSFTLRSPSLEVVYLPDENTMYTKEVRSAKQRTCPFEIRAHFREKLPRCLLLHPGVHAELLAELNAVQRDLDEQYTLSEPKGSVATLPDADEGSLQRLRFRSYTHLEVHATVENSAATFIAELFSDARLSAFTCLHASETLAAAVVEKNPPLLRRVFVKHQWIEALQALIDAAVASPYLEEITLTCPESAKVVIALFKYAHRDGDPHTGCLVRFGDSEQPLVIRRSVPLKPVGDLKPKQVEQAADTVVISLRGVDSPPLLRDRLRFSGLLQKLCSDSGADGQAAEAVTGGAVGDRIALPSRMDGVGSGGEMELENRFSNVDVALAVLWLNEYACDEVHAKVTQDPAAYLVTGRGWHFFTHGVCKGGAAGPVSEARCHSVLAVAHYLRIATLEHLMVCLLASGKACGLEVKPLSEEALGINDRVETDEDKDDTSGDDGDEAVDSDEYDD